MTSSGIKYSNIVEPHERSVGTPPTLVTGRPSLNQWVSGTSPLAIATKLASRASEASRS
jgi:hypothetical protein